MIGQGKLINKINSYTLDTLPHSILLVGDRGSEQDEICKYISNKFNLIILNITDNISLEYINEIYLSTNPTLYIIETASITEREQNILLKFFEEPNPYVYIILVAESKYNLLETIETRSYELILEKYSKEQLEPLAKEKNLTLKICNTPGQVDIANHTNMYKLYELCKLILEKMSVAAYFNALSISNKINFKDDPDKFDLFLFIKMLGYVLIENHSNKSLEMYKELCLLNKKIWIVLNKKQAFENFITNIWEISRDEY